MNHRHDLLLRGNKEDRHAISCEDSQKSIFLSRLHAVAFAGFLDISVLDVDNLIAVDLLHRDNTPIMDTHGQLHITNILADDLGVIANAIRNIKASVTPDALATAPSDEAVQQAVVSLPLRGLEPVNFHS